MRLTVNRRKSLQGNPVTYDSFPTVFTVGTLDMLCKSFAQVFLTIVSDDVLFKVQV